MADRVKVYEETTKKKGLPIWAWLLPLLLLIALLAYFLGSDDVCNRPRRQLPRRHR